MERGTKQADSDFDKVASIVNKYDSNHDSLVSILQDVQSEYHYLPEDALRIVAERLDLPLVQVYGVATFFKAFSLEPRGRHLITVCLGTACHVRGGERLSEKLERDLCVEPGETTPDLKFTLETVNCLGCCALGPVVVIDGKYEGKMDSAKLDRVLKRYE